ncbi:MAG: PRC-barrel domain-containing protein [Anaerolineae bacterium]
MPVMRKAQAMKEMPIVSFSNGEIIAKVTDMLINPQSRSVSALLSTEGGLLSRTTKVIPATEIQVWGEDVVIVTGPDIFINKEELPCHEQCLSLVNQIKGREVVGQDGTRIGTLSDVLIDDEGRLVGYDLGKVDIEGPVAKSKRIGVEATYALGPDVLVVDESKLPA